MSSPQPANSNRRRRSRSKRRGANDIWHSPAALPEAEPIRLADDPGALLRSLGEPPVGNGRAAAGYFEAVAERAAGVAMALALSADLLASDEDE
ncbi:MAG: hypothetical protein MUF83_08265 [Acidimicrobiales bacterium]|jgi:hypothetical protein|nr:hypothetical protein [Acidimicrobiales bacterium]